MSQDNRGTVSTRGEMFKTLPPLPPARPCRIPTRALRLGTNKPTCARESPVHTRVGVIPRLLVVPTWHHSIFLTARKQWMRRRHTYTGGTRAHLALTLVFNLPTSVHASA